MENILEENLVKKIILKNILLATGKKEMKDNKGVYSAPRGTTPPPHCDNEALAKRIFFKLLKVLRCKKTRHWAACLTSEQKIFIFII